MFSNAEYCTQPRSDIPWRDELGRVVYPRDKMKLTEIFPRGKIVVDLIGSEPRTNYERYFADLGTLDDVILAFVMMKCDVCTPGCPFFNWPGGDNFYDDDCTNFVTWLSRTATE